MVEAFENYWNADAISLDRVTFLPIPDTSVRLANLQSGDLDLIERPAPTDLSTIRNDPNLELPAAPSLGYQGVTINIANPKQRDTPLASDPRVRERSSWPWTATSSTRWCSTTNSSSATRRCRPRRPGTSKTIRFLSGMWSGPGNFSPKPVTDAPVPVELMVGNNPQSIRVGEVVQSLAGEAGF